MPNAVGWRKRQRKQAFYFVVISLMLDQSGDGEQIFGYERCTCSLQYVDLRMNSIMKSNSIIHTV